MADASSNPTNDVQDQQPTQPPQPATQRPVYVTSPPSADPQVLHNIQTGLSNVATALAALPENIVNGLREGNQVQQDTPPPTTQTQQPQNQSVTGTVQDSQNAMSTARRGPNKFSRWFFGLDNK